MPHPSSLSAMALATSLLTLPLIASAQSLPAPDQDETGWRHGVAFYLFTPLRTTGTSTVAGQSADLDLDLGDVLDVLDFAAAGRYEAWRGDFGIILDANYVGIEQDTTLPGPLGAGVNVDVRQKWFGLLAAYRVADAVYGVKNLRYAVDIQGGLRYNSIRQEIDITTPGPGNPPVLGGDQDWIEPVLGVRGMWRLNPKWTGIASLELGGFGAGGNDLQIGANVGFDYQPWEKTALTFGYRYFSIDYSDTLNSGDFAYDVDQHGPYFGLKYFF
ncbi:outer membrane protein [Ruegeria jejuensis]|uniref:outer membrane protein n=1 Tax=Ruegeria jejuensis TaxID=3233338 RepID=UPI00355BA02F